MTYQEIITRVVRRLGWAGFDNSLKTDLRYAINESESELLGRTEPTFASVVVYISSGTADYNLEDEGITDFNAPHEIAVYTDEDVMLAHEEVKFDAWLRWNPTDAATSVANDTLPADRNYVHPVALQEFAKFKDKVLISIHYEKSDVQEGYILSVKPAIDGKIVLMYSVGANADIFNNLEESPALPPKFHQYIVAGAVYRMAQIEAGRYLGKNAELVAQYQRIEANAYGEFQKGKESIMQGKGTISTAVVARPFMLYNDVRRRSGR